MLDANLLKTLREKKGLSQAALGRLIGTDYQYVWKLEHGVNKDVRGKTLASLADALDCTTDALLGRTHKGHTSAVRSN